MLAIRQVLQDSHNANMYIILFISVVFTKIATTKNMALDTLYVKYKAMMFEPNWIDQLGKLDWKSIEVLIWRIISNRSDKKSVESSFYFFNFNNFLIRSVGVANQWSGWFDHQSDFKNIGIKLIFLLPAMF